MRKFRSFFTTPAAQVKFDTETGQVFSETTVAIPLDDDRDWTTRPHFEIDLAKCKLPPRIDDLDGRTARVNDVIREIRRSSRNAEQMRKLACSRDSRIIGARSLAHIALESVLANSHRLTAASLAPLPYRLLDILWEQIKVRQLLSLQTWQSFSTVLRQDAYPLNLMRYREQIMVPTSPLHVYTNPLTSNTFEFLTSLSITSTFRVPELTKLWELKNLVALEIIVGEGLSYDGVSDHMMRTWSEVVETEGAFRVLRILKLWNHLRLTKSSLQYLNCFPALALIDVTGSKIGLIDARDAVKHGWKPTIDSNVLAKFEAACGERAVRFRQNLRKQPLPIRKHFSQQLPDDAVVQYIPRSEVPEFLSREEATEKCIKTGYQSYRNINGEIWSMPNLDDSLETWDFPSYTAICRIGELRNDRDLVAAGIDTGDQPLVGDSLLCPLPIVSLRLGGTPLFLHSEVNNTIHKAFYESLDRPSSRPSRFTLQWSSYSRGMETLGAQRLAFIKVKMPPPEAPTDSGIDVHSGNTTVKRPAEGVSRPTSSGEPAASKRRSTRDLFGKKKLSFYEMLGPAKLRNVGSSDDSECLNLKPTVCDPLPEDPVPEDPVPPKSVPPKTIPKAKSMYGLFSKLPHYGSSQSDDATPAPSKQGEKEKFKDTAAKLKKRHSKLLRKRKSLGNVLSSFFP